MYDCEQVGASWPLSLSLSSAMRGIIPRIGLAPIGNAQEISYSRAFSTSNPGSTKYCVFLFPASRKSRGCENPIFRKPKVIAPAEQLTRPVVISYKDSRGIRVYLPLPENGIRLKRKGGPLRCGVEPGSTIMKAPRLKVADIVWECASPYLARYGKAVFPRQRRVLRDVALCRTRALGGHVGRCDRCGHTDVCHDSCRNPARPRDPKCQAAAKADCMESRAQDFLDTVQYYHAVFTFPDELAPARGPGEWCILSPHSRRFRPTMGQPIHPEIPLPLSSRTPHPIPRGSFPLPKPTFSRNNPIEKRQAAHLIRPYPESSHHPSPSNHILLILGTPDRIL